MSEDIKLKLELYKDGKLSKTESESIEKEIEKYLAIKDYLDEKDEKMLEDLQRELDRNLAPENSFGKKINRKIITKISTLTLLTVLACLIIIPMLYLSAMSILGSTFRLDSDKFSEESVFSEQFMNMVFPEVRSGKSRDHTEFYKQSFTLSYNNGLSRKAQATELKFNYSFGKLKKPENLPGKRLQIFSRDDFHALNPQTYFNPASSEWNYLEEAADGTKAQIFVSFKSGYSPEKAFEMLGKQYFGNSNDNGVIMLADTGSTIVMANTNPVYFYERNKNSDSKQSETEYINKYSGFDNEVHKEAFAYGLNQIKKHRSLADYIIDNYSYEAGESIFDDTDTMLSYVEKNGVKYVGAVIKGDTKELLKLKDNPDIYACRVYDIVIW